MSLCHYICLFLNTGALLTPLGCAEPCFRMLSFNEGVFLMTPARSRLHNRLYVDQFDQKHTNTPNLSCPMELGHSRTAHSNYITSQIFAVAVSQN